MVVNPVINAATFGSIAAGVATAADALGAPGQMSYILACVVMYVDLSRRVHGLEATIKGCLEKQETPAAPAGDPP